jgi:DNA-directed RNA polymerase subunit RPC12/RpoP
VRRKMVQDVCPDCGSIITGGSVDELLAATCAWRLMSIIKHRIELTCMRCGRDIDAGTVEHATARILIPEALRCRACGGRPVVSDRFTVRVYPSTSFHDPVRCKTRSQTSASWLTVSFAST